MTYKIRLNQCSVARCFKVFFFVSMFIPSLSLGFEKSLNSKLTDLISPNWPYEAFLAIPRISEMRPTLSIEISAEDQTFLTPHCVELFYLELQQQFEPEASLERESLHHLLCRAMKRAIKKTPDALLLKYFRGSNSFALSFDFFAGEIKVIDVPYPPLSPSLKLENVFLDETEVLQFGGIDLPDELELEINQAPL